MDLNFRIILLSTTLLVLSGMLINGLVAPDLSSAQDMSLYSDMGAHMITPQQPAPEKKIIEGPITNSEDGTKDMPVLAAVVSSEVISFVPQFDENWCKDRYPGIEGKKISLNSEDIIIKNKNGTKITDYQSLCLQLAPTEPIATSIERTYAFDDAYVDVKGIGPMKINSIRFTYENAAAMKH